MPEDSSIDDGEDAISFMDISIGRLLITDLAEEGAEYEVVYYLQDRIEEIITMKVGEVKAISLSRDEDEPALLQRIL